MDSWLDIHPKVKAAVAAVALIAVGSASAALNGSESWENAALQTGTAALAAIAAYLKGL